MTSTPPPIAAPLPSEYAEYYGLYIQKVPAGNVLTHLKLQRDATVAMLEGLDEPRAMHRYEPGKWSVKQVLGHIVDGERLFAHRALAIARRDPADQPSMDQEIWMAAAGFDDRTLASLLDEYRAVRAATLALFATFAGDVPLRQGRASGNPFTVRSLVHTVAGHELHHLRILRERYGLR